jgi:hypothetical protein
MRRILLVLTVAACTHSAASGPAWPKPHVTDDDGGESIAPRDPATSVAVATQESGDDDKPAPASAPASDDAAAPAADAPASTPAAADSDDVIEGDEIVIDVGPDD